MGEFSWISLSDLRRQRMTTWMLVSESSEIFWGWGVRFDVVEDMRLVVLLGSEEGVGLETERVREGCETGADGPGLGLAIGRREAIGSGSE